MSSDELIEIVGPSGGGKTTLAIKIGLKALMEQDIEIIYIDTSNYVNYDNISHLIKQRLSGLDEDELNEKLGSVMSRFKVYNLYDMESLIVLLATLISSIKTKRMKTQPSILIIDSLSSLVSGVS